MDGILQEKITTSLLMLLEIVTLFLLFISQPSEPVHVLETIRLLFRFVFRGKMNRIVLVRIKMTCFKDCGVMASGKKLMRFRAAGRGPPQPTVSCSTVELSLGLQQEMGTCSHLWNMLSCQMIYFLNK